MKKSKKKASNEDIRKTRKLLDLSNPDEPNWSVSCENYSQVPTVGDLGLCEPCVFGEADTIGGNW